ncbi:PD-(D/E)XK nuclease family protein [bacterium]|nr:PD-(D/E)XK nuclease family protein [bacterium]
MAYASQVWVSHSSISDFLRCPRAYYLKNVYKDPKSGNKIQTTSPALALGSAVHEVIESLSTIKTEDRFKTPLIKRFDEVWSNVSGKKGGFQNTQEELEYKSRGEVMLERIRQNPGPISKPAVKINMDLPKFPLTPEEDLILCGKIDWLEYLPDSNSVNIIDFKTGQNSTEDPESLQLPIYHLLVRNCQRYEVLGAYYWYIEQNDEPTSTQLPDYDTSYERVLNIAKKIQLARKLESFKCPNGNEMCRDCKPYEAILNGEGEFVYTDSKTKKDVYLVKGTREDREGEIL